MRERRGQKAVDTALLSDSRSSLRSRLRENKGELSVGQHILCFSSVQFKWRHRISLTRSLCRSIRWRACCAASHNMAQGSEMLYFYVTHGETKAAGYFQIALRSYTPVWFHLHSTPCSHPTSILPLLT